MPVGGVLDFIAGLFDILAGAFHSVAAGDCDDPKQNGNGRDDSESCSGFRECFHGIGRIWSEY